MATSYQTKRCIFELKRKVLTMLSKTLNVMQKKIYFLFLVYLMIYNENNIAAKCQNLHDLSTERQ